MHASRCVRIALVGCVLSVTTSATSSAVAQDAPKADNRARAQELFDSALADAEAGNLAAACPKFLASQEADPKASTLLNLGSCYEKNGQTASAWGAFREAEGLARKIGRADWEQGARTRAEALEPRLVKLTVDVPAKSRVPGLTVTRDGAKLSAGEWGVAIPVDPGDHTVTVAAPGFVPWETKASVREVSSTLLVPDLVPLPKTDDGALVSKKNDVVVDEGPRSWWTPLRTTGVVVAGVGVVATATGAILGLVAKSSYDDARSKCTDGARGCTSTAVSDADSAYGLATGATVLFVVGGVATAAGAGIVLFAPNPARPTASASLRIGPGSVGIDGRW